MKTITVCDEYGNKYTLEYNRKTVIATEGRGFDLDKIDASPVTMITLLVEGAFMANHPSTKRETIEKIYTSLKNKEKFIEKLTEMYTDSANTLIEEGNAEWEANW